jgi:xanthine dehydrogenase YagS FAD-binding subunit
MNAFEYIRAQNEAGAVDEAHVAGARYLAGGTTLVDLMRLEVLRPSRVVDISALPLVEIEALPDGGVRIGALAKNSDVASHQLIVERFPALSEALLAGASPQVRNMASVGGNMLQGTRCPYFRDLASACNKREPGSGCAALDGYTRSHAILGTSDHCIATHPSDMCVALVALDAVVIVRGGDDKTRRIAMADFHTLPGQHPEIESQLQPGELITHVEVPATPFAAHSRYVKVRDRMSFAFALASTAAALDVKDKKIRDARVALGGVATKPWRATAAEKDLIGRAPGFDAFKHAAATAVAEAKTRPENAFKVELVRRTIVRALARAGGLA